MAWEKESGSGSVSWKQILAMESLLSPTICENLYSNESIMHIRTLE